MLSLLPAEQRHQSLSRAEANTTMREQVKTFLVAGHESSALALSWAFLLLAENSEADARLATELHTVLGERPPTFADLPRLTFTAAIIQETLRLYPPLWMTGRQVVAPCEIGDVRIPSKALLLTSQWAVQRDPRYFPYPDTFRPERWESPETADLPRFAYFPFGGGPRVCIGQSFALMEMTLLLAAIAQHFRLGRGPGPELWPWVTLTLHPPSGHPHVTDASGASRCRHGPLCDRKLLEKERGFKRPVVRGKVPPNPFRPLPEMRLRQNFFDGTPDRVRRRRSIFEADADALPRPHGNKPPVCPRFSRSRPPARHAPKPFARFHSLRLSPEHPHMASRLRRAERVRRGRWWEPSSGTHAEPAFCPSSLRRRPLRKRGPGARARSAPPVGCQRSLRHKNDGLLRVQFVPPGRSDEKADPVLPAGMHR